MKKIFAIVILALFGSACNKELSEEFGLDINNPINDTAWSANIPVDAPVLNIPSKMAAAPKMKVIDANTGGSVRFSDSLIVSFAPGSLLLPNGSPASGNVNLHITQLKKKGDFIRFGRPTTSRGHVLTTGGSFYVTVTKDGVPLSLAANQSFNIRYIAPSPSDQMKVFYPASDTSGGFSWEPAADTNISTVAPFIQQDSSGINTIRGYNLFANSFQWINVDKFRDSTAPATTVTAFLPPNYTNLNTSVFMVFKNENSVVQVWGDYPTRSFKLHNVPTGVDVAIISVSLIGEELYLATHEARISANMTVNLTPTITTRAALSSYLDGL